MIEIITGLKQQIKSLSHMKPDSKKFPNWKYKTEGYLKGAFAISKFGDHHYKFNQIFSRKDGIELTLHKNQAPFKEEMLAFLRGCVTELEIISKSGNKVSKKGGMTQVNMQKQSQTVEVKINIKTKIKQIIEDIYESEPDEDKAKEAEKVLLELQKELESKKPKWSVVKNSLTWVLNFGRDAFIELLPLIQNTFG